MGYQPAVFFAVPMIGFSSLGTSDFGLVIQPVIFYSFCHEVTPTVRSTGEGMAMSGISSEGVKTAR